jgi:hypothetical protein
VEATEATGSVAEGAMIEVHFFDIEMRMQNETSAGSIVSLAVYRYLQEWK